MTETEGERLLAIHDLASARLRPPNAEGMDEHALSDMREIERISRPAGHVDMGVRIEPSEAARGRSLDAVSSVPQARTGVVSDRAALDTTIGPDGMQKNYLVLSDEERAKGFVRPVRRSYTHEKCGTSTRMGLALCETYARDPGFYSGTFCSGCREHFPVGAAGEFTWDEDGAKVGT